MKNLSQYVNESLLFESSVPNDVKSFCYRMMKALDYSKLKETVEQDPDRFVKSKDNEELLLNSIADDSYEFMTSPRYYEMLNKGKSFDDLSSKEQAEFDRKNGDIIVLKAGKPLYFIDVKISNNYLGAVNMGSLIDFNPEGYYLCINKSRKTYKVISHKTLVKAVKDNPNMINPVVKGKKYEGYPIEWEGEKITSEYFIKGKDIEKL